MKKLLATFLTAFTLSYPIVAFATCSTLTSNIDGYWKFEGNSNDSVGSNNGSDTTITYSTGNGKIGQGAGFNGSSSLIKKTSPTGLPSGSSDISVCGWARLANTTNDQEVVAFGTDSAHQLAALVVKAGGNLGFQGFSNDVSVTWSPSTATWYFLCYTLTGQSVNFYVNASQQGTTQTLGSAPNIGSTYLQFGAIFNSGPSNFWTDALDEIGIWGCVLTTSQITTLYNNGTGLQYPFTTSVPSTYQLTYGWW